jgi:hypothetical protein
MTYSEKRLQEVREKFQYKVVGDNALKEIEAFLVETIEECRGEVEIGEKDNQGEDEWWCHWYKCPSCGVRDVAEGFDYCPDCGTKLKWVEDKLGKEEDEKI